MLYVGRVVNPEQARAVINTAILTAVIDRGPTVISMPGDVAASDAPSRVHAVTIVAAPVFRPDDGDLEKLAGMIEDAKSVAIFGGDGCRDARDEVIALANKLNAPVGYSFRGKLLGYGGAYRAIHDAELLLLLGTDFPFSEFLPGNDVRKVQIDRNPKHIGRRTAVDLALVGDVKATLASLLPKVSEKSDTHFLEKHLAETREFNELLNHYVEKGPGIKPIRPEFLVATLSELGDLATQVQRKAQVVQIILNNESLDFVNIEQQEAGLVPFGTEFKNPNFAKVAEAMGAKGIRLEEPGDVKEALGEALAHTRGPVVVDAVVDPFALSLPSHAPFHTAKGYTLSMAKQILSGRMDSVIRTVERNIRLV